MNNIYLYLIFFIVIVVLSSIDYFVRKLNIKKNINENFYATPQGGIMLCDEKLMKTKMSANLKEQLNTLCGKGLDELGTTLLDRVVNVQTPNTAIKTYVTKDLKYFVNPGDIMTMLKDRTIKVQDTATPDKKMMKTECLNECIKDPNCNYASIANSESANSGKCFHYKEGTNSVNISDPNYSIYKENGSIEYSVEFWLKINHKSPNWRNVIHHGNDNGQRFPGIWIFNNNQTNLTFRLNTINENAEEKEQTFDTEALPFRQWTHNIFTVRNNYIVHYINGVFSREITVGGNIKWPSDDTKFYIVDPWHNSSGIELGYVKWYPLLLNEQYVKNAFDNRPALSTDWRCVPNINVPMRLVPKSPDDKSVSVGAPYDAECMSSNNKDCHWRGTEQECKALIDNIPEPLKPLTCGEQHAKNWGGPGYENPGHWCAIGRDYLFDLDNTGSCKNYNLDSKGLSTSCLNTLWKKAGCITDIDPNYSETGWWKTNPRRVVENDMKEWARLTDDEHRRVCYGPDKSKWPENQKFYDMKNHDRGGYDIRCFQNPSKDKNMYNAEYCKSKCLEDPNCKSANYIKPGGMHWGGIGGCCYKYEAEPKYPIKDIDFSIKKDIPRQWRQIDGALKQVSLDGDNVCGVNSADNIYCNSASIPTNWRQVPGSLKNVSLSDNKVCGTNGNDDIWCNEQPVSLSDNNKWKLYQGKMKQVDLSYDKDKKTGLLCGVDSGTKDIKCTNYGDEDWNVKSSNIKMSQVSVDGKKAVAISEDGTVYCTEDITVSKPKWNLIKTTNKFLNIELSNNKMCGADKTNLVWCADFNKDNWVQKPGYMKYVSIDKNNAYAINKNDNIFALDDIHWNAPKGEPNKYNAKCRDAQTNWEVAGGGRINYLDRIPVRCATNEVLTGFKLEHKYNPLNEREVGMNLPEKQAWKNKSIRDESAHPIGEEKYKFRCCEVVDPKKGVTNKIDYKQTPQDLVGGWDARYLDRQNVDCNKKGGLQSFHFLPVYSNPAKGYYNYQCNNFKTQEGDVDFTDCYEKNTNFMTEHYDLDALQQLDVKCKDGEAIGNFKLKRTAYNNQFYYNYTCCKPKIV